MENNSLLNCYIARLLPTDKESGQAKLLKNNATMKQLNNGTLISHLFSLIPKSKKWFKQHGRKLAMASVAIIAALAMIVELTPIQAATKNFTWTSQADFESGSGSKVDTTSNPDYLQLGEDTASFQETFDTTTYRDAGATTADWVGGQVKLQSTLSWNLETVDSSGTVGLDTSIDIDSSGNPHIAYQEGTAPNGNVKYAKWTGSSWSIETVAAGNDPSIALDSSDNPHISYYYGSPYELKYAKKIGSWSTEAADTVGSVGMYSSIALDSNNKPHISYMDLGNSDLKYTKKPGASWSTETVESAGSCGYHTSMTLDSSNNPYIVHYKSGSPCQIRQAKWTGSSWSTEAINSDSDTSSGFSFPSIALDSSNNPHVSYSHVEGFLQPKDLEYAKWTGSSWSIETVTSSIGNRTSIAIDSDNNPRISYPKSGYLEYAKKSGASWNTEVIESIFNTGDYSSIALDSSDNIHISYYNDATDDLKYAKGTTPYITPATAQSTTIDSTTGTITKATLTATENNDPATSVSYQMSANGGSNWESVTSGVEHTFTNTGTDLRWKATLTGTSTATPRITQVDISYSYKYPSSGTLSGLVGDAGTDTKVDWASISWDYTSSNTSNYYIYFQTRTSDNGSDWSSWSSDYNTSKAISGSETISGSDSRYIEVKVILYSSDNQDTPVLDWVRASYNTCEATSLAQERVDGTSVATGGYAKDLKATFDMTGAESGTTLTPEVEARPVGTAFTNAATHTGSGVAYNGSTVQGSVTLTGLSNGTSYHWQIRVKDSNNRVGAWSSYGGNQESEADFIVETTPPTVNTFNINSDAQYTNSTTVTLTIDATDADSGMGTTEGMRFSNDGSSWSSWEAYGTSKSWTLTSGDEDKTVYAQFKDVAGNVSPYSGTVTYTVSAGADDGSVKVDSQSFIPSGSNMIIGNNSGVYHSWIRFANLNIAQGATINQANLKLVAVSGAVGTVVNSNIYGEAVDNSSAPVSYNDFINKTKTTAFVAWDNIPAWPTAGTEATSPDIKTVIQEIVDRAGWSSGNALQILWWDDSSSPAACRYPAAYESSSRPEPKLEVNYTTPDITDTITLDTQAPTDVTGLSGYSDDTKTTSLTSGNWYSYSGANSPYFEWPAATDANSIAGYMVYWGTNGSADPATDGSLQGGLAYSPSGMTSGTTYYLRIKAKDNPGNYSSNTTQFIYRFDNSSPDAVADLAGATIDTTTIRLTWSTPSDDVGVTGYSLERKQASEPDGSYAEVGTPGAVTTFDDTVGLEAGMSYNYRMITNDAAGNQSGYSNVATANTEDTVPPSAPTLSSVTAQSDGFTIDLVFTGAYDAVGVAGYKIERSKDASNWTEIKNLVTSQTTNVSYQDNDTNNDANGTQRLTDNQIYYYRVRAYDQAYIDTSGASGTISIYSNTDSDTTPDVTAPSAPTGLSSTPVSSSAILVQWSASTDMSRDGVTNGKGVLGYKIYQASSSSGPWTTLAGTSTTTSFTDSGRAALTTYYYKVRAVDSAGSDVDINHALNNVSDLSTDTTSATTYTDAIPSTPINTSATATQGDPNSDPNVGHQIKVTFTGAAASVVGGTQGYSLNHYEVYRYQGDTFPTPNPGGDGILTEAEFNSWVASTSLVRVGSDISVTSQTQTTRDGTEYQYVDDNSYEVYDNNLNDNQTYKYGVFVFDNTPSSNVPAGPFASGVSPVASTQTPDVTPPSSPSNIEILDIFASLGSSSARVIITWTHIVQPADFKEYRLYRSDDGTSYTFLTSTTDNYYVDGTVDDTSTYYYKITSADTTVNAGNNNESVGTVSDPVTPGQRDVTPPSLTQQPTASTGVSTATVSWKTDETADGLVEYGTTSDYTDRHGSVNAGTADHSVVLRGLSPDTTYHYRVKSEDQAGNVSVSSDKTFKTQTFSITGGPSVSPSTNTAAVSWTTNFPSNSLVEYRAASAFSYLLAGSNQMTTNHSVTLANLSPATIYYYKVTSEDSSGNKTGSSGILAFSTSSGSSGIFGAPSVSRLAEAEVTATTVKIVWQTSFATTTWLDYSPTSSYGISLGDNVLNNNHMVVVTGLTPGTTYHYRIRGTDIQGNEYISPDYTFTALAEPAITDIQVEELEAYQATITFKTNINATSSVNYGKTLDYGKRVQSEDTATSHKHTLIGLQDDQEYHFQIEVKDEYGHSAKSSDQVFTTLRDTKGPKIKQVRTKVVRSRGEGEKSMVIVTWQTDEPATSKIEYQAGTPYKNKYQNQTPLDDTLNLSHTEMITGLKPSTAYHFRIIAKDKRGNQSTSVDYTVLTQPKSESVLDMIIEALEETFSWIGRVKDFIVNKWQEFRAFLSEVF